MKIKDKPDFKNKPKPITFLSDETVREALKVMCDKDIGSIIVIHPDETVAGIVTERDMMKRVLGKNIDPNKTPLSEIMSKEVKVANEDDDLLDWMYLMSKERFRHLPIVNSEGKLVNTMSQGDFVAYTWPDLYDKIRQDLRNRLGKVFQLLLLLLSVTTLGLIALK